MAKRTLTLLEVTGIQPYIFGSNQLAQNIGASELVTRATTRMVVDILGADTNAYWDNDNTVYGPGVQYHNRPFSELHAEVVYAGGGNAMLLFHSHADAVAFVQKLTRKLLEIAPGLDLVATHAEYEHATESLAAAHHALRGKLAHRKHDHAVSAPLLGLGITAECVYTGLPAIGVDTDPRVVGKAAARKIERMGKEYPARLISHEVAAKLMAEEDGNERLHDLLPQVREREIQGKKFGFIYDFSELGEPNESSYIAVVHADGNQMGTRFAELRKTYGAPEKNDDYIIALRDFSKGIRRRAKRALEETVDYIFASLPQDEPWSMKSKFNGVVAISQTKGGAPLLPFRPIVFGGDDITFVCDGRLGLDLAAFYLQAFCEEGHDGESLAGGAVFARAGVAVVKTHYPFSRAYMLADDLAGSAKQAILDFHKDGHATAIDWHFATTGMMFALDEIRHREYRDANGRCLLMRPVFLNNLTWRSWQTFNSLMTAFQKEEWKGMRNKVLALRDALRQGEKAVELFIATHDKVGKLPPGENLHDDMTRRGWYGNECGYYDAIEAIDFFVSLKPEKKKEPTT